MPKTYPITLNQSDTAERNELITGQYFDFLDKHLDELIDGKTDKMLELVDIAKILFVSQKQLIKIIQTTKGEHPCHFYMQKIISKSKMLLEKTNLTISDIAFKFTYDPSNFTKFFKKYTGSTPTQYRNEIKEKSSPALNQ